MGYESRDVATPDPETADALRDGRVDWVTVTSSAIARSLIAMFGQDLARAQLAAISPLTAGVLERQGSASRRSRSPLSDAEPCGISKKVES